MYLELGLHLWCLQMFFWAPFAPIGYRLYYSSVQFVISFSFADTFREVVSCPVDPKSLNDLRCCNRRNTELFGETPQTCWSILCGVVFLYLKSAKKSWAILDETKMEKLCWNPKEMILYLKFKRDFQSNKLMSCKQVSPTREKKKKTIHHSLKLEMSAFSMS